MGKILGAAIAIWTPKAQSESMNTTNVANSYLNYAFWALGLICAVGITVAVLVSR
jgi:hypothetical protein